MTVGSDDGAEFCELVGLYILSLLVHLKFGKAALYRDDGAMAIRGSPRQAEIKTKEVASIILPSQGLFVFLRRDERIGWISRDYYRILWNGQHTEVDRDWYYHFWKLKSD